MKQLIAIKVIIFVVFFAIMACVIMSSCSTRRVGCPINAQHGFGPGRMR